MSARPALNHVGIFVRDLEPMLDFYRDVIGMSVTDRGETMGHGVVFLSSDPHVHHQLVLADGRGPDQASTVCQLSFLLPDLAGLREVVATLARNGFEPTRLANHGTSWSVYMMDPEDNILELYVDSPWYIHQPRADHLDLSKSDDEIWSETEAMCRQDASFMLMTEWSKGLSSASLGD